MTDDRPILIDFYCCAGGAAKGYDLAGFDVIGVDNVPRPNYPYPIIVADALDVLRALVAGYTLDVIAAWAGGPLMPWLTGRRPHACHASCPCQYGSTLTTGTNRSKGWGGDHPNLVGPTRDLLDQLGLPYVIEQPSNHQGLIRRDLQLCTDMFYPPDYPSPWVQRHRDFELSGFTVPQPPHPKGPVRGHRGYVRGYRGRHGDVPGFFRDGPYVAAHGEGGKKATVAEMQHALGIDWTDVREELTEALPVWLTRYIGTHLHSKTLEDRMYAAMKG
jgi:hypothetical protein